MNSARNDKEKGLISALIIAFLDRDDPPTREEIEARAVALAPILGFDGDLQGVVTTAETIIPSRMNAGVSLVDIEAAHDQDWIHKREIRWTYFEAYSDYLKNQNWHPAVIQTLSDDSSKILGLLQDPASEAAWNRRGLVIGHVQSGKTANYMGVIAKAADSGYKFIIVIAGIHTNLRKQTQERIDEGFIGRSSDPANRINIGVGLNEGYPHPATLTNINNDFNQNTAANSGWKINDFSKPIILVIKKNVKTLDALFQWLKVMNTRGDGRISDVPMLMIDDEADNASINTNKEDLLPTRTNGMIRRILGLFIKSCYIGYTATPFANIFINPEVYDPEAREELFPKDFIYSLDAPTTYFGPDKVFLDESVSEIVLEPIGDCEEYLPLSHENGKPVAELPPSLYLAIDQLIVARAIRNLRGQTRKHSSMLINVSRFVSIQREVKGFVSLRIERLRDAVKANYLMPEAISSKNVYMTNLHKTFDRDFTNCGRTWEEVKKALWGVFENIRIYNVNSKSDDVLDYGKYEREGAGLTAIAIGGISLSRGLTINGLTISYMYRNTRMYDTLMQMGRWFGYRPGFEDLCKVHLSQDSINWYSHIARASEELRQQIRRMRRAGLSPKDFGLYVQSHPDSLLITAANKMRSGEAITVNQNFTGKLIESTLLPLDPKINETNEQLIEKFWRDAFGGAIENTEKGWFIPDVGGEQIKEFLLQFKSHKGAVHQKTAVLDYLERIMEKFPKGDVLLISKGPGDPEKFRLGAQERTAKDAKADGWLLSKYRLASRGDEKLGLRPDQIAQAEADTMEDKNGKSSKPSDYHYRIARNKPLLMIHILYPKDNPEFLGYRVPAFGVSFPDGLFHTRIEIMANRIWVEQMYGSLDDNPDEEDYDD